jgi:BirA family transcriptional regulator, biotin operon repressor / biotin---[acetyl-CoA-carboxylase] ligase
MRPKGQSRSGRVAFGAPHRHYARTDSTNTRARELAAAGAPHGTVVSAAEQTGGRGRQGRTWTAPAGKALLYSAVVRPLDERHMLLPLAVPLAVCEAAEELEPGVECGVKWPNDVQINGRKLAGVLIEARPQDGWAVIGVGLNLSIAPEEFPPDLRDTAVSIFHPSIESRDEPRRGGRVRGESRRSLPAFAPPGLPPDPSIAAEALNRRLEHWIDAEPDAVLKAWRARDALRGRQVAWEGGSGVADGVDDRGYLLVIAPGGDRVAVGAGEVHLTRS